MDLNPYLADNRNNWNDRVAVHLGPDGYEIDRYVDDPTLVNSVIEFDSGPLGDLSDKRVVHFQCHLGTDTISLDRIGACEVVGLDFSDKAIESARDLAARTGSKAQFVVSNVYDAPVALGESAFDLVYTSVGAINWLDDISKWAEAVAGVLVEGGRLYLRDVHPSLWSWEEIDGQVVLHYDYFQTPDKPLTFDEQASYVGSDASTMTNTRSHEWNHSIPSIVTALADAGMRVVRMEEHEGIDWPFVPSCEKIGDQWFLPEPLRGKVPAMFTLEAVLTPNR